jgi:hypothetical protein
MFTTHTNICSVFEPATSSPIGKYSFCLNQSLKCRNHYVIPICTVNSTSHYTLAVQLR